MTEASRQPKDKNYNLISALYQASDNVETFKTYAQDAESEATRSWWSSSMRSSRTTKEPPSGPRRCLCPACRASKSKPPVERKWRCKASRGPRREA
jgi:hypothetical protein